MNQEERQGRAELMAEVLGIKERPRDEQGRYVSADAGDRTPEEPPAQPTGAERLRDFLLYDQAGWPRRS